MKNELKNIKFKAIYILLALFIFGIIVFRMFTLTYSKKIDGINLQDFAANRTNKKEILYSSRGTIYDAKGNALAKNTSSYTLIAYLSPKRTTNEAKPKHVIDPEYTAFKLSEVLDVDKNQILGYLNNGIEKNLYQVELGPKTKELTELKKDEILELNLPGIDFIESEQRHYPYGDFASYIIGYVRKRDVAKNESIMIGEMGVESYFNDKLTGENGYTFYQKDRNGYKIAGTKEIVVDPIEGMDIYLTIDSTIQLFVEDAISNYLAKNKADFVAIMLADAKSGAILASGTYPSFDPNKKNIKNYLNLNTQVAFEPGSTMKIFTYMAAMEEGNYVGTDTYKSGEYTAKDGTKIRDHYRPGWGVINHDTGFLYSSNTGIISVIEKCLNRDLLKKYFNSFGFGEITGIELSKEASGKIDFKYQTEILNAGFGQGITTTPVQFVKALTAISNDGIILQPYLIDKIIDSNTNEVIFNGEKKELSRVASTKTVNSIKSLMREAVNSSDRNATGRIYNMPGYDLIAKTGTAQVAEGDKGYGDSTIRSLAGIFPGDDPKVVIYIAVKNPSSVTNMTEMVKTIIKNTSKYLNIYDETKVNNLKLDDVILESYINKSVKTVKTDLENKNLKVVVIGDGEKIVKQYPNKGTKVNKIDRIFLVTNYKELKMINLTGFSYTDCDIYFKLIDIPYKYNGIGFAYKQSIPAGVILNKEIEIVVDFKAKY